MSNGLQAPRMRMGTPNRLPEPSAKVVGPLLCFTPKTRAPGSVRRAPRERRPGSNPRRSTQRSRSSRGSPDDPPQPPIGPGRGVGKGAL
jgi:hypothetical protein